MKNNTRISRINDEIFKEVSQIVRGELKDVYKRQVLPREILMSMISVT